MANKHHLLAGALGMASVITFLLAFILFSVLNPDFDPIHDYISKLGANGQPHNFWWNLIGFAAVGIVFGLFGLVFGFVADNRIAGSCLLIAGLGFALGAVPTDFENSNSSLSSAHFASICIGLAGWFCTLARLSHVGSADKLLKPSANIAAAASVLPMIAMGIGLISEPIGQRIVLAVVFGWVVFVSRRLVFHRITDAPAT